MDYNGINSVFSITGDLGATIMHQYAARANEIRVQVFNFEVIDCYRTFKQFVLYLFDYNPFSVYGDKNITCPKVYSGSPSICRHIERMRRRGNDFFAVA